MQRRFGGEMKEFIEKSLSQYSKEREMSNETRIHVLEGRIGHNKGIEAINKSIAEDSKELAELKLKSCYTITEDDWRYIHNAITKILDRAKEIEDPIIESWAVNLHTMLGNINQYGGIKVELEVLRND